MMRSFPRARTLQHCARSGHSAGGVVAVGVGVGVSVGVVGVGVVAVGVGVGVVTGVDAVAVGVGVVAGSLGCAGPRSPPNVSPSVVPPDPSRELPVASSYVVMAASARAMTTTVVAMMVFQCRLGVSVTIAPRRTGESTSAACSIVSAMSSSSSTRRWITVPLAVVTNSVRPLSSVRPYRAELIVRTALPTAVPTRVPATPSLEAMKAAVTAAITLAITWNHDTSPRIP
ncbi:hypothetical protein C6I20_09500 [Aeromicrobium sp. A1-2]|nr:hypothetical protein C6I20_09500 [Aeromicrobium sp. A1-2]